MSTVSRAVAATSLVSLLSVAPHISLLYISLAVHSFDPNTTPIVDGSI